MEAIGCDEKLSLEWELPFAQKHVECSKKHQNIIVANFADPGSSRSSMEHPFECLCMHADAAGPCGPSLYLFLFIYTHVLNVYTDICVGRPILKPYTSERSGNCTCAGAMQQPLSARKARNSSAVALLSCSWKLGRSHLK